MRAFLIVVLLVVISGCLVQSYSSYAPVGVELSGGLVYGPVELSEKAPTINKLLSAVGEDDRDGIIKAGFRNPVINTEPNQSWAVVKFQDGLSTYIMYVQFFYASEPGREIYFVLRGVHTAKGNAGDDQTVERANRVANALLKTIRTKI